MGSVNARGRVLRASLVVGQFRIRQWLVIIERQLIGFVEFLRIFLRE
jgi:hypothetical protein